MDISSVMNTSRYNSQLFYIHNHTMAVYSGVADPASMFTQEQILNRPTVFITNSSYIINGAQFQPTRLQVHPTFDTILVDMSRNSSF